MFNKIYLHLINFNKKNTQNMGPGKHEKTAP